MSVKAYHFVVDEDAHGDREDSHDVRCRSSADPCEGRSMYMTEFRLPDVVRQAVEEGVRSSNGRRVEWVFRPLPNVFADPELVEQALHALVTNALNFTGVREPARIEIAASQSQTEVTIKVQDNRSWIRQEDPDSDAGALFQATTATVSEVQSIAGRHGGRSWVEPCEGGGTRFCIALPKPTPTASPD